MPEEVAQARLIVGDAFVINGLSLDFRTVRSSGKASNSTIYPRDPDQGLGHR
jgi:hypothetical protein